MTDRLQSGGHSARYARTRRQRNLGNVSTPGTLERKRRATRLFATWRRAR